MQSSGHRLSRTAMPVQQQGMDIKCPAPSYDQQQQAQMYTNGHNARFNYDAYPGQKNGGYQVYKLLVESCEIEFQNLFSSFSKILAAMVLAHPPLQ